MDLVSGILANNQSNLMQQVQVAVARKALDQQELQGAAAIKMIQSAGQVAAGDPMVAAATGLGGSIDIYG
jgi:hypothetical protein